MSGRDLSKTAQTLVAVGFSLWRAAFLADKTGRRHAVVEHVKTDCAEKEKEATGAVASK